VAAASCARARAAVARDEQQLVLLQLAGGEFIVNVGVLALRCAALAAGEPLPPLVLAAAVSDDGEESRCWLLRGAAAAEQSAALRASAAAVALAVAAATAAAGVAPHAGSVDESVGGEVAWSVATPPRRRGGAAAAAAAACAASGCGALRRARAELAPGACPVALAGWLLDYPLLYVTRGAAAARLGGEPLLLCTATYALPPPLHRCAACEVAGAGAIESRVAFSAPLQRCEAAAAAAAGSGAAAPPAAAAAGGPPPGTPPDLAALLRAWEARLCAEARALACAPPLFSYEVVTRSCVTL